MEKTETSSFMELIKKRFSVRKYKEDPVEEWKIEEVIEAARIAPSASNSQPWRFIVVQDEEKRLKIANEGANLVLPNKWLRKAPVIIVIGAETDFVTGTVGEGLKKIAYHQVDIGIAGEHLVLRATELGLGTCWIGWFKEKYVRKLLDIPEKIKLISLISLGYPDTDTSKYQHKRHPVEKILFRDTYGNPWKNE